MSLLSYKLSTPTILWLVVMPSNILNLANHFIALRTRHYIHFGILCLMTLFFKAGFIALSITLSDTKSDSMRQYAVMGNAFASMGYLVCVAEALMCGIEITRMRNEGKEVKELLP